MATETTKLRFLFAGTGKDLTITYSHADADAEAADIKTAGLAIVTNGSIFTNPPTALKSAKLITTSTTDVDLS